MSKPAEFSARTAATTPVRRFYRGTYIVIKWLRSVSRGGHAAARIWVRGRSRFGPGAANPVDPVRQMQALRAIKLILVNVSASVGL